MNLLFYFTKPKSPRYQEMTVSPENKAVNAPPIKNGPKGTSDFMLFFCERIRTMPTIAPEQNAKNKARINWVGSSKSPRRNTSFPSPNPIIFPWEAKCREKNKAEAITAPINCCATEDREDTPKPREAAYHMKENASPANKILSGRR